MHAAIDIASFTLHGTQLSTWHPSHSLAASRRLFFRTKSVVFAEAEGWKKRSAESDAMLIVDAKARFQADTDSNAEKRTTQSDDADLS